MMDLIEQIESYSPQTGQPKNEVKFLSQSQNSQVKAPLIQSADPTSKNDEGQVKKQEVPQAQGCTRFFKLKFYENYFKVTEADIIDRIKGAIIPPFSEDYLQNKIRPNPDFYGPLWITVTIVVLLGVVSNLSNQILSFFSSNVIFDKYFFSLEYVRYGIVLMLSYGLGVPATLFLIFKFMKYNMELPELISVYGYSLSCFIPALILCILPINFLQWLLIAYAFVNSTIVMCFSLKKHIDGIKHFAIFSIITVCQLALFLIIEFQFLKLKA